MSASFESGVNIVSWRVAASMLNLCGRCHQSYTDAHVCDACLREADADIRQKRGILFPQAYDAPDVLSAIA
jgi:hypothetical protein